MIAVEFTTNAVGGTIAIPEQYRKELTGEVRVIVLKSEEHHKGSFERICSVLEENTSIHPFQEIVDPIVWQQKVRSEWDNELS